MAQDYQQDLSGLREILSSNYSTSDLEDASLEELQDMKADVELYEFLDGEIGNFRDAVIQTKDRLMESIKRTRIKYQEEATSATNEHSPAFYEILNNLLKRFEFVVQCTSLPDPLNDWWSYSYEITDAGINLLMNHYSWSHNYGGSYDCRRDEIFVLLEISAKLLTVSEYAETYGVQPVTVRQWIRRAKLRNVVKVGREWRIPELTEKPEGRGYCSCKYSWSEDLADLPEKYGFLSAFQSAWFWQDDENDSRFCVQFFPDTIRLAKDERYDELLDESGEYSEDLVSKILGKYPDLTISEDGILLLTAKEREELELYMIGNPLIRCTRINSRTDALAYSIAEFGEGDYDGADYFVE